MNRIGLKISCLVASVLIWVQVATTSVVEQSTTLPLRVVGLDEKLTLAGSQIPPQVDVVVRSNKLLLLTHRYFNRYIGEVRINFAGLEPGPSFSYPLAKSDVFTDLAVVGITPPVLLRLQIDNQVERRFPVELVTKNSLQPEFAFYEAPSVTPDSVLVSGPERFFTDDPVIRTVPVDLSGVSAWEESSVALVVPHGELELAEATVRAVLNVGRLEDRTLANIPVIPLVDAGRPEVGVSPPVADIMVRGVVDSVLALTKSRFLITVPVGSRDEGVYELSGQVDHPSWLTVIRLEPAEFQVIVGDPPREQPDEGTGIEGREQGASGE
ncbi:MAG: hypothetical protein KOO60_11445 [Gemmatimonadales bacterium]|nr:hypothetical protein [Gemmatimonadales bacterium]